MANRSKWGARLDKSGIKGNRIVTPGQYLSQVIGKARSLAEDRGVGYASFRRYVHTLIRKGIEWEPRRINRNRRFDPERRALTGHLRKDLRAAIGPDNPSTKKAIHDLPKDQRAGARKALKKTKEALEKGRFKTVGALSNYYYRIRDKAARLLERRLYS